MEAFFHLRNEEKYYNSCVTCWDNRRNVVTDMAKGGEKIFSSELVGSEGGIFQWCLAKTH
jgi:hypothetical protein